MRASSADCMTRIWLRKSLIATSDLRAPMGLRVILVTLLGSQRFQVLVLVAQGLERLPDKGEQRGLVVTLDVWTSSHTRSTA